MKIWMKVTSDKYALPVAFADTTSELARMCNTTPNVIYTIISKHRRGLIKHPSYICVIVEERDDNETYS